MPQSPKPTLAYFRLNGVGSPQLREEARSAIIAALGGGTPRFLCWLLAINNGGSSASAETTNCLSLFADWSRQPGRHKQSMADIGPAVRHWPSFRQQATGLHEDSELCGGCDARRDCGCGTLDGDREEIWLNLKATAPSRWKG